MIVRVISDHFARRWRKRLRCACPEIRELNSLLCASKKIRNQMTLYKRPRGKSRLKIHKILAEWYHDGHGILIRVDMSNGKAVTVIALRDLPCELDRRTAKG